MNYTGKKKTFAKKVARKDPTRIKHYDVDQYPLAMAKKPGTFLQTIKKYDTDWYEEVMAIGASLGARKPIEKLHAYLNRSEGEKDLYFFRAGLLPIAGKMSQLKNDKIAIVDAPFQYRRARDFIFNELAVTIDLDRFNETPKKLSTLI